jgi:multidrug efflux pump subunit AcrB
VDVQVHQVLNGADLHLDLDRTRAAELGLTAQDVANSINLSLASSAQVAPNFWFDPKMGMTYRVAPQTPQHRLDSINALGNTPIAARNGPEQVLSNLATVSQGVVPVVANHHNVQPVFDVYGNVQDSDLESGEAKIKKGHPGFQAEASAGKRNRIARAGTEHE